MLRVRFKTDRYQLAYKLWLFECSKQTPRASWRRLRQELQSAFGDYPSWQLFLPKRVGHALSFVRFGSRGIQTDIIPDKKILGDIFDRIFGSMWFRSEYEKSERHRHNISEQWRRKRELVSAHIVELYDHPDVGAFTIFVTDTALHEGSYLGNGEIEWGIPEIYPDYNVVGIAHEIMHALTEKLASSKDEEFRWKLHAMIYLSIDEDLKLKIHRKAVRFDPVVTRHFDRRLISLAKTLDQSWRQYRANGGSDLRQFLET